MTRLLGSCTVKKLDFLKVVRLVFWSGVVGPGSLARAPRSYDRASRSQSRYALKSSTCEQVYEEVSPCTCRVSANCRNAN